MHCSASSVRCVKGSLWDCAQHQSHPKRTGVAKALIAQSEWQAIKARPRCLREDTLWHTSDMLELALSHNSPTNTTILSPDGSPLYVISTPFRWGRRTTTISNQSAPGQPTGSKPQEGTNDAAEDAAVPNELARIEWHSFQSSRLIYKGQILETKNFMPPSGLSRTYVHVIQNCYKTY